MTYDVLEMCSCPALKHLPGNTVLSVQTHTALTLDGSAYSLRDTVY